MIKEGGAWHWQAVRISEEGAGGLEVWTDEMNDWADWARGEKR